MCLGGTPAYSSTYEEKLVKQHLPKSRIGNIDYHSYTKKIKFILVAVSDKEYNAATTYLQKPSVEDQIHNMTNNVATSLDSHIAVGSFAGAPVALINIGTGMYSKDIFKNAMIHFPKVKYVISIGTCYGFQPEEVKLCDVLISSVLTLVDNHSVSTDGSTANINIQGNHVEIKDLLERIFCIDSNVMVDFKVSMSRTSNYHVSNIIFGVDITDIELLDSNIIKVHPFAIGGDAHGKDLLQMQMEGIIDGFIVIKSVIEYVNHSKTDTCIWKFTGAMSALHYVKEKMMSYICKFYNKYHSKTHENMCNICTFINHFDKLAFECRGPIGVYIIIQA